MNPLEEAEDILLDMKDKSELMVDLAYSAVLYNSMDIAREVEELEAELGESLTTLNQSILELVAEKQLGTGQAQVILRVAQTAEMIANAALEIADVVLREVEPHPVLAEAIRTSDSAITKVRMDAASEFVDVPLRDCELETETGMRILAIKRAGKWNVGVDGDSVLVAEDVIVVSGPAEAQGEFRARCEMVSE